VTFQAEKKKLKSQYEATLHRKYIYTYVLGWGGRGGDEGGVRVGVRVGVRIQIFI
jgi:hypothetical protein